MLDPDTVRQRRLAAGLTATQLAYLTDVSWLSIYRYEKGLSQPRIDTLGRLAKALDCEAGELLKAAR